MAESPLNAMGDHVRDTVAFWPASAEGDHHPRPSDDKAPTAEDTVGLSGFDRRKFVEGSRVLTQSCIKALAHSHLLRTPRLERQPWWSL